MDRTQLASITINQIGENHVRAMSMPVGVISDEYLKNMHDITASSLGQLQAELKPLYRRMTAYANTRDPNDVEFHRIRTDAAAAIELADIYLSPTAFPQRAPRPENMQPPEILSPSTTSDAPTRPYVPTRMDADAAMATPSADGAVDASSG